MTDLVRTKFGDAVPPLNQLERRATLALVNSHPVIGSSLPMPSNVIEVGGLQIRDPKSLPVEIEQFIDASPKECILIALRTAKTLRPLAQKTIQAFVEAFRALPDHHFVWELDIDWPIENLPPNVMTGQRLPLSDILGHKKIKLFIAHSEMLNIQEAIWRDVPFLGIIYAYDHHRVSSKDN